MLLSGAPLPSHSPQNAPGLSASRPSFPSTPAHTGDKSLKSERSRLRALRDLRLAVTFFICYLVADAKSSKPAALLVHYLQRLLDHIFRYIEHRPQTN